jgi:inhibitor of KinA
MYGQPRFLPAGDRALVVELGDGIDVATNARTRALAVAIDLRHLPGIVETVPTYRSLLIHYDPLQLSMTALASQIAILEEHLGEIVLPPSRRVEIPTVYGGEFGPDMPDVVAHTGLTEDEVVSIHASTDYLVYMMGFITGFPYLGGMSASIATPRLSTPRTKVPVGSVGIAQQQTGIYPVESPGGWRLIGRTPVRWFDPTRHPPVPVEAGDFIRFVPVSASDYERIRGLVQAGTYTVSAKACD